MFSITNNYVCHYKFEFVIWSGVTHANSGMAFVWLLTPKGVTTANGVHWGDDYEG